MKRAFIVANAKFRNVVVGSLAYEHDNEIDIMFFDAINNLADRLRSVNPAAFYLVFDEPLQEPEVKPLYN